MQNEQLPHLDTFSIAAELGSFTATARALDLTQAAVSQRVHLLERTLGASLFDRRGGRVSLTEAGRKLCVYAQRIADLHREARREITGHEPSLRGDLSIAASSVPGEHLLPVLLSGFSAKYPHLHVRAAVSDSVAVLDQVERGEAAVGVVGRKIAKPHLAFRYFAHDRILLVVPPGHPLVRLKKATIDQVARHPLIVREAGSGLRHCFENALERIGRSCHELRITLELGSNEAIKEAVQQGAGIAVLSEHAVKNELGSGRLFAVPLKDIRCGRDLYVVQDCRRALPLPARLFLNYLETHPLSAASP